ncbi:MAG: hypothetical protein IT380_21170 [Myxococcales bacterium]|nr:hypothetical protein [Myxococcales bacterium]
MTRTLLRLSATLFAAALLACGGTPTMDGGTGGGGGSGDGGLLLTFEPPSTTAVNNSLLITISGESFATEGIGFPPASARGAPYFLDGWEVRFTHAVVVVDRLTVSENPDLNPNDPSQTGEAVARAEGPWAVDLAKGGPLVAKELNGQAVALARLTGQNLKAGTPSFAPTAKYAFGYQLIAARAGVYDVNLDAEGEAAYREMASNGWTVWLSGTATWKGDLGAPACRSTGASYDFARFPKAVAFSFGFRAPVDFKNCENPELSPAGSRGLQTQALAQTTAQVTFHLDHPFWEALEEDAPLRWDVLAARRAVDAGVGPSTASLDLTDLAFDFQAPKDAQGAALPWRTCGPTLANERSTGTVAYDPVNVPVNPSGGAAGLKSLSDYMTYNLSTFGHLNNDGLCFPARSYPSPP